MDKEHVVDFSNDLIRKLEELKQKLSKDDVILLAEAEHEIMKYIDRHLISDLKGELK